MKIKFTVPGEPKGKGRPRFNTYTKATYTTKADKLREANIRYYARHAYPHDPIDEPCAVEIVAYFPVRKSYTKKRIKACLSGEELPAKKPDVDNISKQVLDGLNPSKTQLGLYTDDKLVVKHSVTKIYDKDPRLEITVTWGEELKELLKEVG